MATERDEAIKAISGERSDENESLDKTLNIGYLEAENTKRLELSNAHDIARIKAELGWFGCVFGGEGHAPTVVASVVILLGFIFAGLLWIAAYTTGQFDKWASEAHIPLGAAISALSYVFGRGTRDRHKLL